MFYNSLNKKLFLLLFLVFPKIEAQTPHFTVADSLYQLEEYTRAIEAYQKITPKNQYAFLQIAKAHRAKGTLSDALEYYKKAIAIDTSVMTTKLAYASLLMTTKKFKKADSVYTALVAINNKNPNYQYRLGLAKKKAQDSSAIEYFKEAFRLDNTHQKSCFEVAMHYLKKRKYDTVLDIANKGLESYPENPELINVIAQNYLLRKYYEEAIPHFEKLIALNHTNEFVHASLALCYDKNSDLDLAATQYNEAIKYNNKIPLRYTRLANVYVRMRKYNEAIKNYQQALLLKNLPIEEDYLQIAATYRHQEKWEQAIKYAKLALKENPDFDRAQYQLATYADAYYKDPETKLKYYQLYKTKFGNTKNPNIDDKIHKYFSTIIDKRIAQLEEEIEANKKVVKQK